MPVTSLLHQTDFIFRRFSGTVTDKGSYIVVETRDNPTFYWGNYLIFPAPPGTGDVERWQRLFERELPNVKSHSAFSWEGGQATSDVQEEFFACGFQVDETEVSTTPDVNAPRRLHRYLEIRSLRADEEWLEALELQVKLRPAEIGDKGYREFKLRENKWYRQMVKGGLGYWFGGYLQGKMVGSLGIFCDGNLARFQNVETHPEFRRRGVAGTMIFHAARTIRGNFEVTTFVIAAGNGSSAVGLYRSLGFRQVESCFGFWKPVLR